MNNDSKPLIVVSDAIIALPTQMPGAEAEDLSIQLLNVDSARGLPATIIEFKRGAFIPAHFHEGGSEAHFVLEGEMINAGRTCGPGTFLTHAAGVVHGPHSSKNGCRVLTIRSSAFEADDHHVVQEPSDGASITLPEAPVEADVATKVLEADKSAATSDNPTNPTTG